MYFYYNGNFLQHNEVININDRGFLLGDGVFTTIKIENGKLYFIEEHLARLQQHAKLININFAVEQIKPACVELLQLNNLASGLASMRITLTRGTGAGIDFPISTEPTVLITTSKMLNNDKAIAVGRTSIVRNQFSPLIKIKSLNYLELILNRQEAKINGFDDGYMCNTIGAITECSVANIFFVNGNSIITPAEADGILNGITRKKVIECCKDLNIPVDQRSIYPDELTNFSAAFITNSLIGIQKIHRLEQHILKLQNPSINRIISHYNLLATEKSAIELS